MHDARWEAPILELSRPMTAYLLWLIARDLGQWGADRQTKLEREEAHALAEFLAAFLPTGMQTEVGAMPPMLRAG